MNRTKSKGFTLVELMIVVAIIGILGGIAYPSYTAFVKKGNRADAVDALMSLSGRMEEFYLNNDTYVGATVANATSREGLYTIAISTQTAFAFKLIATPTGSDPECTTLTYDQLGTKGATGTGASDCW